MTPEQKREQWLKRLLPALVVVTGYFVVFGPGVVADAAKAQQEKEGFVSRGVSPDVLPDLALRKERVDAEVAKLKQSQAELDQALRDQAGFLAQPDYANQLVSRVSAVLTQNGLRLRDAAEAGSEAADLAPVAVRDIAAKLVKEGEKPKLGGWRFRFSGAYPRVHQALHELSNGGFPALPLSLSMAPPDLGGDMEWKLVLWTESL